MLVVSAVNGCIESPLQWYKFYSETLMEKGFELNPYDTCVSNKMVNGKQFILVWYVMKQRFAYGSDITRGFIQIFENHFGELLVTRGKQHTYWGGSH